MKGTMSEYTKTRWQNRRCHKAQDGDISAACCGMTFKDIRTMVLNPCEENLTRGGKWW